MLALTLTSLATLPLLAFAQDYGYAPAAAAATTAAVMASPVATSSVAAAPAATQTVVVGGGTLVYTPSTLVVPVGGKIVFQFKILNHSVTQSQSFAMPCASLPGGIDSGFMPVANNSVVPLPTYTVTINDTMPVYFHCKQNNHCAGGMVFIANPSTADPIDQFILNAKASAASATSMAGSMAAPAASVAGGSTAVAASSAAAAASTTSTTARSSAAKFGMASSAAAVVLGAVALLA